MGLPQMAEYWNSMTKKQAEGTLGKNERKLFDKVQKARRFLRENSAHPGLNSHDIHVLTRREGFTILGVVPHPSKSGYKRVPLSGKAVATPATEKKKKDSKKRKGPSKKGK